MQLSIIMRASPELKSRFQQIKNALGPGWKDRILASYPSMPPLEAKSLIDRLNRMGLGRVTPTLSELERFREVLESGKR